jgi:hypothetical protein
MTPASPEPDTLSTCLLGVGGSLLGLAGLLGGFARLPGRGVRYAVVAPLVVAALACTAAVAGLPRYGWLPPLGLAALWTFVALALPRVLQLAGRLTASLGRYPRLHWGALVLAGPALLLWQEYQIDRQSAPTYVPGPEVLDHPVPDLQDVTTHIARTDAGRTLPLARPVGPGYPSRQEKNFLSRQTFKQGVIHTEDANGDSNCHGWVFTGGRFWVRGQHVEQILHDNRYSEVRSPRAGDLAVYRNPAGEVTHTGIVRLAAGGLILIESKWGQLGRYVHTPSDHCYTDSTCTYYRSPRQGHLLRGLEAEAPADCGAAPCGHLGG